MRPCRVVPLDVQIAWRVRGTLRSVDLRHPAYVETATGQGPCGVCLRPFRAGVDRRIVFVHDPFHRHGEFPLPSPVQLHEDACPAWTGTWLPPDVAVLPLTLDGYGAGREHLAEERHASATDLEAAVLRIFARPTVSYIHLRDTVTGFFVCELTRVPATAPAYTRHRREAY